MAPTTLIYFKEIIGTFAIFLTLLAFTSYIKSILAGRTKPHVFSWVIWGIATFIVFLASFLDKGGAGAWAIGISAMMTMSIAVMAYAKKADITITRTDWVFLAIALSAIPIWYMTSNSLWAVIILTGIDVVAYFPSIRKAYHKPFEEQMTLYVIMSIRNLLTIVALENYSLTTMIFPVVITIVNTLFISMVMVRRKILRTCV